MKVLVAKVLVVMATLAAGCVLAPTAASAQAFCLRGCDFGNGDCSYSTYNQCQASAAGRTAWCEPNPDVRQVSDVQHPTRARISRRRL